VEASGWTYEAKIIDHLMGDGRRGRPSSRRRVEAGEPASPSLI
jgi:hypothetical protein